MASLGPGGPWLPNFLAKSCSKRLKYFDRTVTYVVNSYSVAADIESCGIVRASRFDLFSLLFLT